MAVTNQTLLDELQRIQARVNGLAASIVECGERAVALETWRNGHIASEHAYLHKQLEATGRTQERQGDRLWKVALQVTEVVTLLAVWGKMAGAW